MPLPRAVREFCYAAGELGQRTVRTSWGQIVTDSRYPRVWEANHAAVLEPARRLRGKEIREALIPELVAAGAASEHIEVWEAGANPSLVRELSPGPDSKTERYGTDPDVVMAYADGARAASQPPPGLAVEVVTDPDPAFLEWYRASLGEFGMDLSDEALHQMVDRTCQVLVPAGLRWFLAVAGGEMAGYTSLMSLGGVGYVDNVVTMPAFRGGGVASATILSAVRASRESGDGYLFLLAERGGRPQRIYEHLGFREQAQVESFTRPLLPSG